MILWLAIFCFPGFTFSAHIVDIYGAKKKHSEKILHEYTNQVIEIESELAKQHEYFNLTGIKDAQKIEDIQIKKGKLIEKIKKQGKFLYTELHTTTYQDKKNLYTTIEVIEKERPERLMFINTNEAITKHLKQNDLIEKMQEYETLGWKLSDSRKLTIKNHSCPVYHCVFGFNHPRLRPYLNIFNIGAIKEKTKILKVLSNDPAPERRASAAFLVGHFKNPEEIISILSERINDQSLSVRNNVIRVMSETIEKAQINHINVEPFLNLLNSPYGTDRNKALSLLANTPLDKKSRLLIIHKGQKDLLALLHLKQPNNHDWAYVVLKKISGENYDEYDISAWERWFSEVKKV